MKFSRDDLGMLLKVSETIYESGVCPPDIKNPKACFAVMLAGAEFDLGPMQSLRSLQVVKGKIGFTADFTVAQCLTSPKCKYFRLIESTDKVATYETLREGDPEPTRLSYTIAQATRAGLTKSDTWSRHTEAMLRARCAAALARATYPDRVAGVRTPDEVEEIETFNAPPAPAQLPPPARPEKPVEPPASQGTTEQPPVATDSGAASVTIPEGFALRVAEIELPGEAVAVWMKHRAELDASGPAVREAAWRALCEHTEKVGKMRNAKVWLEKAITEEDARTARNGDTKPAEPPALTTYRARLALAPTLDALTAMCLEMAPTVAQHREAAWGLAVRRATDLGADEAMLKDLIAKAGNITKEPAVWKVAADVLIGFAAATDRASVAAVVKRHGGAVAKLPKAISSVLIQARDARLVEITPTDVAAQIEDEIRRAASIPDLEAIGERVERELTGGTITADQAKALTALHEKAAAAMEMEPAA